MAAEIDIAEALVKELNDPDRPWHGVQTAERSYAPVLIPEQLDAAKLQVIGPYDLEATRLDRSGDESREFELSIVLQQRVNPQDGDYLERLDGLTKVASDIHEFLRDGHRLATATGYAIEKADRPKLYDVERLYVQSVWGTEIIVTIGAWE